MHRIRTLSWLLAPLLLGLGPLGPVPAPATANPGGRVAIGDSVMLGAAGALRSRGFRVNARVSRQFATAPGIMSSYGRALPRNVVLHLGTNGTVSLATCRAAVNAAGGNRHVFLVNNRVPRSWESGNNSALASCASAFPGRATLVDWYGASAGRGDFFASDGVHLTRAGIVAFAGLIDRAVDRA